MRSFADWAPPRVEVSSPLGAADLRTVRRALLFTRVLGWGLLGLAAVLLAVVASSVPHYLFWAVWACAAVVVLGLPGCLCLLAARAAATSAAAYPRGAFVGMMLLAGGEGVVFALLALEPLTWLVRWDPATLRLTVHWAHHGRQKLLKLAACAAVLALSVPALVYTIRGLAVLTRAGRPRARGFEVEMPGRGSGGAGA